MQLRWALWAMAIGSSSSKESPPGKKASPPSPKEEKKKSQKEKKETDKKNGNVSSRRSLFRKSSSAADEPEERGESEGRGGEEGREEEEEEQEQSLRWAADALLPRLRALEAGLLDRAVSGLWSRALDALKAAEKEQQQQQPRSRRPSPSAERGGSGHLRDQQQERQVSAAEAAAGRWVDILRSAARDAASSARASVPEPHAALFVARALGALLDRVDALLCEAATGARATGGEGERREKEKSSGGGGNRAATASHVLPASFLPFDPRYPLTFTSGVGIKLAVGRIGLWAADAGVASSSSSSTSAAPSGADGGGDDETGSGNGKPSSASVRELPRLFPRLRAVADLLMMPKDALTDASARLDVLPHLPLRAVCGALARFKPDDNAPDPLPPGLLDVLREQAEDEDGDGSGAGGGDGGGGGGRRENEEGRGLEALLRAALAPAPERTMLARGLVPEPLSLEQSPESEDELDELERAVGGGGAEGDSVGLRFDLLRELWSSAR